MELRNFIKNTIREELKNKQETVEEFILRFEKENSNPNFIKNHLKVPNFRIEMVHDGNVILKNYNCGLENKCETNTFNFIKSMVKLNNHRYYPVSGWCFLKSTTYYEHFWVYDTSKDIFLDVTPTNNIPYVYGGVINYNINKDILNSDKYSDVPFLLGKAGTSLYKNYQNNETLPISKKQNYTIFDFIHNNSKYKDLSNLIKDNKIENMDDLKQQISILERKRDNTRNNHEYDYYDTLIQQIKNLNI